MLVLASIPYPDNHRDDKIILIGAKAHIFSFAQKYLRLNIYSSQAIYKYFTSYFTHSFRI